MTKPTSEHIVRIEPVDAALDNLSVGLRDYLTVLGLPNEGIFVEAEQRKRVLSNLPNLVKDLDPGRRKYATYISKFVAACGAGLFDAALNFLWDEVVTNLRLKVARFDLAYFYDTAVTDAQDRKNYTSEDDLKDVEDWALIRGCLKCGILSPLGYKHLDHIRDMRNWASAAHPNQYEITGYQLVAWLETCLNEVLVRDVEGPVLEVGRLLGNLRTHALGETDVPPIAHSVNRLPDELAGALLRSTFGMYCDPKLDQRVRTNLRLIAKPVWLRAPEGVRLEIGLKYGTYTANADIARKPLAREYLEIIDGLTYLPESELVLEVSERVEALRRAHTGWDNFYNEATPVRALRRLVPATGEIPKQANSEYVRVLCLCRMGRRSGVALRAKPAYDELIDLFGPSQIHAFLGNMRDDDITSRLNFAGCRDEFRAITTRIQGRTVDRVEQEALDFILSATDLQLPKVGSDARFQKILGML